MKKKFIFPLFLFLFLSDFSMAQSIGNLRQKINQVLENQSATVGIAIKGINPQDTISINGNKHLPMQSVFKYHLALAVLNQVDQGKLDLNDSVFIQKEIIDRYSHLWSPLRKKYPNGARVPLVEILKYTISLSDNLGCDLLLKRIGGTEILESYIHKRGIKDISIKYNEILMQAAWERQYENWTTANAANKALRLFYENTNDLLSAKSRNFLLNVLKETQTGEKSIKGLLPRETVVAHKTGRSVKNDNGLTGAFNDIGIVFLPDGSYFYLSVFISNSRESLETNEKIISKIARLTWSYFNNL